MENSERNNISLNKENNYNKSESKPKNILLSKLNSLSNASIIKSGKGYNINSEGHLNQKRDLRTHNINESKKGNSIIGGGTCQSRTKFDKDSHTSYGSSKENKEESEKDMGTNICKSNFNKIPFLRSPALNLATNQVGLENLGNTCYMNTSLQCLLHSETFLTRLFSDADKILGNSSIRPTPVSKAFYELCLEILEANNKTKSNLNTTHDICRNSVSPYEFKKVFGDQHKMFAGYTQEDTQEFLRMLLQDISEELNRVINIPQYRELESNLKSSLYDRVKMNLEFDILYKSREDSLVIDTFFGQTVNIFTCEDCQFETYSFEKFLDIPLLLEIEGDINNINVNLNNFNLSQLLDEYFKTERFKWDSPCENKLCKKKSVHEKNTKITILPDILIVSFQRYNSRIRRKNTSKIEFEEILDISKYIDKTCIVDLGRKGLKSSPKNLGTKYYLYAVSNHTGSLNFGHYFSYIKINDTWYEFNDNFVSKCYNLSTNSNTAYVLFYTKQK